MTDETEETNAGGWRAALAAYWAANPDATASTHPDANQAVLITREDYAAIVAALRKARETLRQNGAATCADWFETMRLVDAVLAKVDAP